MYLVNKRMNETLDNNALVRAGLNLERGRTPGRDAQQGAASP